jgi:uncharacterized protein
MAKIYSSIACNLDAGILSAALPLFEEEKVQAIEWSFDTLYKQEAIPEWFTNLVKEFAGNGRLVGHGVFFSLFSGRWSTEQQSWLDRLKILSKEFRFDHITEHFGFMTGDNFHAGAPVSIPFTPITLNLGRDRLNRIQDACACSVGLENLAFAYSLDEVKKHGCFLNELIEPLNGFIILDLHNLYCQIYNFNIPVEEILPLYPLDRVREIHISGGSWENHVSANRGKIRRDTHDDAVPSEVFGFLKYTIDRCKNLKFVVLEQLGSALKTEQSQMQFRRDFHKMDLIVRQANKANPDKSHDDFLPANALKPSEHPFEDFLLHEQQLQLSQILETALSFEHAHRLLLNSHLANSAWAVELWEPYMLETAMAIAKKWKNGF